jgi:hypothetical protein
MLVDKVKAGDVSAETPVVLKGAARTPAIIVKATNKNFRGLFLRVNILVSLVRGGSPYMRGIKHNQQYLTLGAPLLSVANKG